MKGSMILQLQTFPAVSLATQYTPKDLTRYRKELIKVGKYVKGTHAFEVTIDTLHHWAQTFKRWVANGNKVPIPPGHDKAADPTLNQGWVEQMFVEGNSLIGIMELLDPKLALVTDVSISVPASAVDGKGNKYMAPIDHVSLCTDPVVGGLEDFEQLSLSLKNKEKTMEFLKKIAEKLGIAGGEPTEEAVLLALESAVPASPTEPVIPVQLSGSPADTAVVKLVGENRAIKLSGLVKAGRITPAIKDLIAAKYVEPKALTLELSKGDDGGFDLLYAILSQNASSELLQEQSGVQSLELASPSTPQPNAMTKDINRRRQAAGMSVAN